ncbi:hypothetical protein D5085_10645 [Ectothiorhodospiraceae bacterium BW-2]|nr:hypothetical protein D5085_10645 [Ectothiorhodospiraceae bacterium BW-2]
MLKSLTITAYKSVAYQSFVLAPLTVLTGTNASGKSTLIQAILIALSLYEQKNRPYLDRVVDPYLDYDAVHCRWSDTPSVKIALSNELGEVGGELNPDGTFIPAIDGTEALTYEEDYYYLSANRLGPEEVSQADKHLKIGEQGQFVLATFEALKDKPIEDALTVTAASAQTLKAQTAWWLSEILDLQLALKSEKITSSSVKNSFDFGEIGTISPLNTGAGNSYLAKIIIMGLVAKPGQFLLIENPEIHLHPKAQAKIALFIAHLVSAGVQVIIETHSEHLLNRLRYQIYQQHLLSKQVAIYYKADERAPFESLYINAQGHFVNNTGQLQTFPSGFFDATLAQLLEIG